MRLSLLGQDGAETGLSFSSPTADLAPPGGLPPPNGWGEGNDSPCQTCACTETHGDGASAEEPDVGESMSQCFRQERFRLWNLVPFRDAYPKMVFPNVPHHSFYPHRRGYRISHARIFGLFFAGLGCGYAAANSATQKQKQDLPTGEELAGSAAEGA
eukprot:g19597.t1